MLNQDKNLNKGLLLCSRYAFMPNKLEYCGGDQNSTLFEVTALGNNLPILDKVLQEFQTLYPYLKLIAKANNIADPFDIRVVEAYWIGNNLLANIPLRRLYNHFVDGLNLKKKMKLDQFEKIMVKIPKGALPHHSFHVFNIWIRTGHAAIMHTLNTMDQCRIGWGKIIKVGDSELEIITPLLAFENEELILSQPQTKKVKYKMLGETFIKKPQPGDWVSYHWDWACDKLNETQVKNLEKYTLHNLAVANKG